MERAERPGKGGWGKLGDGFHSTARIICASVLSAKENVYVEAARAISSSHLRVMLRHIVPNVMAPFLITAPQQLLDLLQVPINISILSADHEGYFAMHLRNLLYIV